MRVTIQMPDIGEGVAEGQVIEWLKQPGDVVQKDEPVVSVMTDKATVELPSPHAGTLAKLHYKKGEIAKVHTPLYDIETEEEMIKPLATPATRRIAKERSIDLSTVEGTGKEGRITKEDLGEKSVPLVGVPHLMAEKMANAKREIPHFSYFEKVDATRLVKLYQKFKEAGEKEGIHVTYLPFFIRALSLTIKEHPKINSSFAKDQLIMHDDHNIGVAMSTQNGLIVPVLKKVQEMSLEEIIRSFEPLKARALKGELTPDEMRGSSLTLTNFGVLGHGASWATPIINAPEVAILGVNKIQKQPLVKHDALVLCETLNLSWSFDHRVVDGELAAYVSTTFASLIDSPAKLL